MGVTIEVTGGEALASRLLELDQAMNQPLRPLFETVSEEWVSHFKENFRNQGDSSGRWAGLSPTTQKRRVKAGYGASAPILIRTSDLLNSIQTLEMAEESFSVGTRHESARLLQFGGDTSPHSAVPDRPVPARPFVSLAKEVIDDTFVMVEAYWFPEPGADPSGGGDALA